MSRTAIYTRLASMEETNRYQPPRIVDRAAWERFVEENGVDERAEVKAVLGEWANDGYPRTAYDTLLGFKQYGDSEDFAIRNVSLEGGYEDRFFEWWNGVAGALEDFEFYTSSWEARWPRLVPQELWETPLDGHSIGSVYRVVCRDHSVDRVEEYELAFSAAGTVEAP